MTTDRNLIKSKLMTAAEAAEKIINANTIAASGFTTGYPKAIPSALAQQVKEKRNKSEKIAFNLFTGASTGDELDGILASVGGIKRRLPFQSDPILRNQINNGEVEFVDLHLSQVAKYIEHGILEPIDIAIIEAVDIESTGKIFLTSSSGLSPTFIKYAKEIYIELNSYHPIELKGYHDIYLPQSFPGSNPINLTHVNSRIGLPYVQCDPEKIRGIVQTNLADAVSDFKKPNEICVEIAKQILDFLTYEVRKNRIPATYLPFQSGVGNIANAVLSCMAQDNRFHKIQMYTEVLQDSIFDLIDVDKLDCASTSALTFSQQGQKKFHNQIHQLHNKFVIRPQEISNNPDVIRRMGVISMNTAIEADIYGNVNSTHVMGSKIINGIGGSGDFTRNAYLSIFMIPSTAKEESISAFVPMASHVDHNEHSTQIIVSEHGLADLRGLCPVKRAETIIDKCAHPKFKDGLKEYLNLSLKNALGKHMPHDLKHAFDWHVRYMESGTMLP